MKIGFKLFCAGALVLLAFLPAVAQKAQDKAEATYKPAETSVAVLFCTNSSSEKWKDQKDRESKGARNTAYKLFAERGFRTIPSEKVDEAVAASGIDFSKEDQWTKANFYKVGKDTGADLVVFILIKQTREKVVSNIIFGSKYQGEAEIEAWLLDAKKETPILNDVPTRGQAEGGMRKGSERRVSAVEFSVRRALEPTLKPYPKINQK